MDSALTPGTQDLVVIGSAADDNFQIYPWKNTKELKVTNGDQQWSHVPVTGRVIAFEPDPQSFAALRTHCILNSVSERITLIHAAAGRVDSTVHFEAGRGSESHEGPLHRGTVA